VSKPRTFGEEVRRQRRHLELTGHDVLRLTGISRTMLSQVENGSRTLRARHWPALARALRLPVRVLARWAGACEACGGTGAGPAGPANRSRDAETVVGSAEGTARKRR
jgi:transcriptional regulator with XRE-family HTH domain